MKDEDKTRDQLIAELAGLRHSVEVLQKSEAKYKALFEYTGDYALLLGVTEDRGPVIVDANKAALEFHGYTRQEFIGTPVRDLDRSLSERQVCALVDRAISGERLTFETSHAKKDGTVFPVEVSSIPMNTGAVPALVLTVERDITERKQTEEALQESEAQKLAILNGITANLALVNEDLDIIWANNAAAASVSRSPEEMRGRKCYEFWANPEKPCEGCPTLRAFKSLQSESATMCTPDGRIWQESGEPVFGLDGRLLGVVEIAQDITDLKKAEEALRKSQSMLNATGKMGRIGGWEHDLATGKATWTEALYDIVEIPYDQKPPGGEEHLSYYPAEHRERLAHAYNETVRNGTPFDLELRGNTARGKAFWCRAHGEPVYENGKCVRVRGTFQDITERKQMEIALRNSEERYRTIVEGAMDGIAEADGSGRILRANAACCGMLGFSEDELRYMTVLDLEAAESPDQTRKHLRRILTEGSDQFETRYRCKDGSVVDVEMSVRADSRGEGTIIAFIRDITSRKQAEEALQKSERLYRGAIEANGAVVLYQNYQTMAYEFVSEGILDLTGYTAEEFSGDVWRSMIQETVPVGKLAGLTVDEAVERARSDDDGHWQFEVRVRTRGGEERWVANMATYVRDDQGQVHHALGTLLDITERKRLEAELRRAHNLESLGTLAGGIAHDFNNVLTGVTGNLALLERMLGKGSEEYEIAAEAKTSAERTRDLARQLMAFAKGGTPVREATSVEELVRETTDLSLRGSNTKPYYLFAGGLWPVDIDRGQVAQVVQNLVLNADQAMPDGGALKISADNIEVAAGDPLPLKAGRYVVVTVEDEGIGMPEGVLKRIFDPYYTTKEKGHGLGLSIVHRIVTNHGGHVAVSSEPGVGTEFEFHLPAAVKQVVVAVEGKAESVGGTGLILVMDDEETVRRTTGRMLTMLGYEVAFADDGYQALQAYRAAQEAGSPPDVVIMDLTIPGGMGGKEAVVKLHEMDPRARVIVASGYDSDPVLADPSAYGFAAGIRKPIDLDELAEVVARAVEEE